MHCSQCIGHAHSIAVRLNGACRSGIRFHLSLSVARTSTAAQLNGLICDVDVSRVLIYAMAPKQRCCINDTRMLPFYLLMLNRFFFVCCRALAELGVYLLIRVNEGKTNDFQSKHYHCVENGVQAATCMCSTVMFTLCTLDIFLC